MSYNEQMQAIANRYMRSGEPWPATSREIAGWAVRKGLWKPQRSDEIKICAEQMARAMREEYIIDAQGRTVRAKHAARVSKGNGQMTLWADIRTAARKHMEVAFQQRRQQIVGDCHQLKTDIDSFNDNRSEDDPIQMSFNFTYDLEELEQVAAA